MADALSRTIRARVRLIRNGVDLYDQVYYEPEVTYSESTHQRIVLATNMAGPAEVDMAGVVTADALFVQTDRDIKVAVNNNAYLWPLSEHGSLILVGSFTHLYLQNESTTNQAVVELVLTD